MLALPIFPVRLQTSIFGTDELNFRVRNGNGWTLIVKSTNYLLLNFSQKGSGDPWESRTPVCGVRGRRLDHLTNGPFGTPSGTRTLDTLIKSQVLYQLS